MPMVTGCPDTQSLEEFALGRLHGQKAEVIEQHVACCPLCGQTLARLPAQDGLVETMRKARPQDPCPDLVLMLIRQFKRLPGQETQSLAGQPTPARAAGLDFLDPPRQPGELGWLGP